jgi:putative ribosome biogenesis GTPase RsgA
MQNDFDRELQNYFTDVDHLREMFKQWLAAPALPKRMLVIHGVGGVGKSSLLADVPPALQERRRPRRAGVGR